MTKIVTARKDHICDHCLGIIKKGEKYKYWEARVPRFEDGNPYEIQVGIEFWKGRLHLSECIESSTR